VIQGTANGIVLNTNTTHIVVKTVQGVFAANATAVTSNSSGSATISLANNNTKAYLIFGDTSNSSYVVTNTGVSATSLTARGRIKTVNNTIMTVARTSLFTTFAPGTNNLIGEFSAATSNILAVVDDPATRNAGDNANIAANVIFSDGSISKTLITDSGFGYIVDEGVTVYSTDYTRSASAKANVSTQGVGTGYYTSRDGFLSDVKKIHDGYFYQDYSYQVESPIPLDKYNTMLKEVLHVAGTIMFGKVKTSTIVNTSIRVSNASIQLTPISRLTVSNTTNFNVGNIIVQGSANGIILSKNTTHIVVNGVLGSFTANATVVTSNSSGSATISIANNTSTVFITSGQITIS
jgi:hypothetical protein